MAPSETQTETWTDEKGGPATETRAADNNATDTRMPKSMYSSWQRWDKKDWGFEHWLLNLTDVLPFHIDREIPVFQKTDKMPYAPEWHFHALNIIHALWPLIVHQLILSYIGDMGPIGTMFYYEFAYLTNGIDIIRCTRELGHRYGFLDGDKQERDGVPDSEVANVVISLLCTAALRPLMGVWFIYDPSKGPTTLSPWVILEIGAYQVTLDFYYYWYHRVLHESDFLWRYHKKHHVTKHPNVLLTLYADSEQEMFDILLVPLATWATLRVMGFPMGYYDWWVCQTYIVTTELWGHSGLRIFMNPPSPINFILKPLGGQLTVEDHDLHHRQGWKKAANYGKQTCLWDKWFGTAGDRIEAVPENIDWDHPVTIPWISLFS